MDESWNEIMLTRPKTEQLEAKPECQTVNEVSSISICDQNGSQSIQPNQNSLMPTNDDFATISIICSMFNFYPYYTCAPHIEIIYFRF